jgi:FK506-binding nuclear protein
LAAVRDSSYPSPLTLRFAIPTFHSFCYFYPLAPLAPSRPCRADLCSYIGKLESGKQFDANTSGKPFSFVLGKGEVIRGWDEGLAGMSVGGERRLTIPAGLAYGNQKLPGIPKK